MKRFLDSLVDLALAESGGDMSKLHILFPNRRAALFFQKALAAKIEKPVWMPLMQTINEFVARHSSLQTADDLVLIDLMYQVYTRLQPQAESFDQFYPRAEIILSDFNDVDKYLVDPEKLFVYLKDVREVEIRFSGLEEEQVELIKQFWTHFEPQKPTEQKEAFLAWWNLLLPLYKGYQTLLREEGLAYEGMIYRDARERMLNGEQKVEKQITFLIAGFNALNTCEKDIFSFLRKQYSVRFYWDYDPAYVEEDTKHQAGHFLRENIRHFGQDFPAEAFQQGENRFRLFETTTDTAQARLLPELLKRPQETGDKGPDVETAVVLADENLLEPVIHGIPSSVQDINITMGYPLLRSPLYVLVSYLMKAFREARTEQQAYLFRRNVVLQLGSHPLLQQLPEAMDDPHWKEIQEGDSLFLKLPETGSFWAELLGGKPDAPAFCRRMLSLLAKLEKQEQHKQEEEGDALYTDALLRMQESFTLLLDHVEKTREKPGLQLFFRWVERYLRNRKVPFTGEPLTGLQVMGLLETRTLDFKHVIVLSCNEGVLPAGKGNPSLIPFSIRKSFSLPTHDHRDAVFAYYFYRLCQRADTIDLVYNTNTEGLRKGEMSRYLLQMKYLYGRHMPVSRLGLPVVPEKKSPILIEKTGKIGELLDEYCHEESPAYLSPKALNTYIDCPLQFCLKYISRIPEEEEITEGLDALTFGNLFHKSVQLLYEPWLKKEMNKEQLEKLQDRKGIEELVREAAVQVLGTAEPTAYPGMESVVLSIIQKLTGRMLEIDAQRAPFETWGVEVPVRHSLPLGDARVKLGGNIDRMDAQARILSLIDYKTGKIDAAAVGIPSLFDSQKDNRNRAAFQLMLYALMLEKDYPDYEIAPQIFDVRSFYASKPDFEVQVKGEKRGEKHLLFSAYADEFRKETEGVLTEMFSREIPFRQTENEKTCGYCPYRNVCKR